ncbi:MAG: hypothetical protein IPO48_21140 [Saprospiraceae bacterium]|nr:hypothetical protein [Saprospiraceae bacterium]
MLQKFLWCRHQLAIGPVAMVTNADEINGTDGNPLTTIDNTDANDPCDYNAVDQGTPSAASLLLTVIMTVIRMVQIRISW